MKRMLLGCITLVALVVVVAATHQPRVKKGLMRHTVALNFKPGVKQDHPVSRIRKQANL